MPRKITPEHSSFGPCSFIEPKPVVNLSWHCACLRFLGTNYTLWSCRRHWASLHNPHPVVFYYSNTEHFYSRVTNPFPSMQLKNLNSQMPLSLENTLFFYLHSSNPSLKSSLLYHFSLPSPHSLQCIALSWDSSFPMIAASGNSVYPPHTFFFSVMDHLPRFTPSLMGGERQQ